MDPLLAALLATATAVTAGFARTLTIGGAVAAAAVGWAVLAGTGWEGGAALAAFFVSSSMVSRATERRQPAWVDAKGNRRDQWQVLANGGVAATGGLVGLLEPALGRWIVAASLAAAAADTWATSLGALSRQHPRHVVRWDRVPRGTSGGVSLIGSAASVAGAALVASAFQAAGALAGTLSVRREEWAALVAIGVAGMLADAVLGATLQGRFRCPACAVASERTRHRCGAETVLTGGYRWLGNDAVNALATLAAGAAGAAWYLSF